ncbi:MAG: dihydropteroate synthase [Flavobacteriia bacterium]|nr:dihydropteroate synthase [Flavobacteriia bacterium]
MMNWRAKDTKFTRKSTIRIGGRLMDLSTPKIMGIVNITPDSFYDGGSSETIDSVLAKVQRYVDEGSDILDLGAQSTRPKAEQIGPMDEWKRLEGPLREIVNSFPDRTISIDTYHSSVAERALENGAHIINDISGGTLDDNMFATVGKWKVPYILMHIQGAPENMQDNPHYNHVVEDVATDLASKCKSLIQAGVDDIIIDPGFGFGKTTEHNYVLLRDLDYLIEIGHPLLIGISRKSMIWKTLQTSASEALNGTSALHMHALQQGASILRVHDVKEAVEVRTLWQQLQAKA